MDGITHERGFFDWFRISKRIRSVPKGRFKIPALSFKFGPTLRRRFIALALIVLSPAVGIKAQDIARRESLKQWEKDHPPSRAVWTYNLASRGYVEIKDPDRLHRVMRTLPMSTEGQGQIWATQDYNLVAVFPAQDTEAEPWIFMRSELLGPWSPHGIGWQGMELLLPLIDADGLARKPKTQTQRRATRVVLDPRAIRY